MSTPRRLATGCTITVEHTGDSLEAHVDLDGGVKPGVGDRVEVHGRAVTVPFGERVVLRREATLVRAGLLERLWIKLKSRFAVTELFEVTFTPERLS